MLGGIVGFLVLILGFMVIRFVGEGIIAHITDPIFENFWILALEKLGGILGEDRWGISIGSHGRDRP